MEVHDERAMFRAAVRKMVSNGTDVRSAILGFKVGGDVRGAIDAGECLRCLMDPGESPPGTSIHDSSAARDFLG
jgi:hypothetical protein